ncbi:hypothetical protein WMF38_57430 [Sorangium sp. So ce118]
MGPAASLHAEHLLMRADYVVNNADVLGSTAENGDVRVNLGDSLTNEGEAADSPWWGNGNAFISRPADPDDSGACEAIYTRHGNQRVVTVCRDARYAEKAGSLEPGDAAIVGPGDARLLCKAATHTIALFSQDKGNSDESMMVSVDGDKGTILLMVGSAYIELKKGKIVLNNGQASIVLDGANIQIFGSHTALNTKTGNLGVVGVVPPPIGVSSITAGVSGMTAIPSPGWTVSTAP